MSIRNKKIKYQLMFNCSTQIKVTQKWKKIHLDIIKITTKLIDKPRVYFLWEFNYTYRCMHKWVDQFGYHVSQLCLVVAIVMPMLFYKSWNLLKWTWFKYLNLNINMMHKIILQNIENHKNHGFLNSKLMDCTFDCHFFVDYDMVHWLMGLCQGLEISKIS